MCGSDWVWEVNECREVSGWVERRGEEVGVGREGEGGGGQDGGGLDQ